MNERTAVAVFVKYPEPGRVKTRLAMTIGADAAAVAYETMVRHVLGVLAALPAETFAPVLYADPFRPREDYERWLGGPFPFAFQRGEDLGARLADAFATLLGAHRRALAIGTDCLALTASHLEQAAETLARGSDVVVGPAEDGGYYLLGMSRFHPALFRGIAWSTEAVLGETLARAAESGLATSRLEALSDIDTAEDWRRARPI